MNKKNLLLLHGALGCKVQFVNLKSMLSEKFNVYDLNFEGHGGRPSTNEFSIKLFARNTFDYIQELGINSTNIFGYSMGGYVALSLAQSSPELVSRVVTLGTKFNWSKTIAEQEVKMLNPQKIMEKVPAFAKRLDELHSPGDWKVMMKKTAEMMTAMGSGIKLNESDLRSIPHSALIGIGSQDNMVTIDESRAASNLLPNGKMEIIEGFKHPIEKIDIKKLESIITSHII